MSNSSLFGNRNFILLLLVSVISQTGSFFTMVAMPWLVLGLTNNNPVIMSTVMACASLPQAFFILFGGALSDRFSPFKILWISRILLLLVMVGLIFCVSAELIPLWSLYLYAFVMGVLNAISVPASQSLLPAILQKKHLGIANGLVMGGMQVAQILGPITAGLFIWWAKAIRHIPESQTDLYSIALAFSMDALGICIALCLMLFIRVAKTEISKDGIFKMLKQGFLFCWQDKGIALVLCYLMFLAFFLQGTLMAGLPIFTKIHLGLAERAYGNLYAMLGIGTILGVVLGVISKPTPQHLGAVVLCCDFFNALGLIGLSLTTTFATAVPCLLLMGVCGGVVMVAGTTWFQMRTPDYLMGRVVSILMFSIIGLIPLSATITGILMLHYPIVHIMRAAGVILVVLTILGLFIPRLRSMGSIPALNFH